MFYGRLHNSLQTPSRGITLRQTQDQSCNQGRLLAIFVPLPRRVENRSSIPARNGFSQEIRGGNDPDPCGSLGRTAIQCINPGRITTSTVLPRW